MRKILLLAAFAAVMTLAGCEKKPNPVVKSEPSIYLAGYQLFEGSWYSYATFWRDGEPIRLSEDMSSADGMCVDDNGTAYVVGADQGSGKTLATLWTITKEGNAESLTLDDINSQGYDICRTADGTLWIAGSESHGAPDYFDYAVVWKVSGKSVTKITIDGDTNGEEAKGICEMGGSIYVVGSLLTEATLWKIDGSDVTSATTLTKSSSGNKSYAQHICASDGKLYIGGGERSTSNKDVPIIWTINGSNISLQSLPTETEGGVYSVLVAPDGTIYAAGYEATDTDKAPAFWKNQMSVVIVDVDGGEVFDLAMDEDGILFLAGYGYAPTWDDYVTSLWSVPSNINDGITSQSINLSPDANWATATAIVIK